MSYENKIRILENQLRRKSAMSDSGSRYLLSGVRNGDEQAATELFNRYVDRLIELARSQLSPELARRFDPEDVVQSAYRSFFRLPRADRCKLRKDEELWHLLAAITVNKARRAAERHRARKRTVELESRTAKEADPCAVSPEASRKPACSSSTTIRKSVRSYAQRSKARD